MLRESHGPDESTTGPDDTPVPVERDPWVRPPVDGFAEAPGRGPEPERLPAQPAAYAGECATEPAIPVPYTDRPLGAPPHGAGDAGRWAAVLHARPGRLSQGPPGWPEPQAVPHLSAGAPGPENWRLRYVALGLAAVLLSGLVGGVVGYTLARGGGSGGSAGVLAEPVPDVAASTAPAGPVEAVAARVLPSVVQLRVAGDESAGEGSAMVLSDDGLLLTNNHVVEPAADDGQVTAVFQDGSTASARIVGRDPSSDLALVRADGVSGLAPVELGNSESVRVGQPVVAFGSPLGLGGTVTTGIISAVDRAVSVGPQQGIDTPTVLNALQTDAAINPGNSGGPLVDMDGRVIGINSAIATTGTQGGSIGVGFAIPINQARRVADELQRNGRASRAVLGVTVGEDPRRPGALVRTVTPGGAAEQAGIREGDLVVRFGDQRISTGTDLQAAVGSRAPGEVVDIVLADRTVRATLTAAPG